ncbi:MAG: hypothetical protein PVJ38_03980 [Candidatus Bathyarchaeota archaeon]|jgi:hypothetical protein
MKSFIKIYGPPLMKAIKALETIAIDSPEVCIMDTVIQYSQPDLSEADGVLSYFNVLGDITRERCDNIISDSGESLGEYDFFFEWFTDPTTDQLNDLIEKIDKTLGELNVRYTITTK